MLAVHPFPEADEALVDPEAEPELEARSSRPAALRRWRDLAGVAAGGVLPARVTDGEPPHELVGRLARLEFDGGGGEPLAAVGPVEILASDEIDAEQARRRIEERRERASLRGRARRAQARQRGFRRQGAGGGRRRAEREKLDGYRAELEELGSF